MTSATAKPAEAVSAPPTFSYAQAAKGHKTSSAASAIHSSQATSGVSTPAKESASSTHTPSASVNGAASSDAGDRSIAVSHDSVNKTDLGAGMNVESKSKLANSGSLPNSPSFGTASTSTLPKEEDLTLAENAASESAWDRSNQSATGADKPAETTEGRKGKKGKKQKNSEKETEKEKEEVKPDILVAAPPPAVNIWQQRKEAQAAKAKSSPSIPQGSQVPDLSSSNDMTSGQAAKPTEAKRRGKSGTDEGDKALGTAQNGSHKDIQNTNKGQKKGSEGTVRAKDDTTKRVGRRGSRGAEKDEKSQSNQLPPPVEDAISWPTPDTALEEEKRKAQEKSEKEEKEENASNKPRPKEKWVTVPYIPTVTFNTPIPQRGGRGRGGSRVGRESSGRGSHAANGASGERPNHSSAATASTTGDLENRGRGGANGPRAASLPPNSTKRPSSGTRDRKSPAAPNADKSKTAQASAPTKGESNSAGSSQIEQSVESHQNQQVAQGDSSRKLDQAPISSEGNAKASTVDFKGEQTLRGSDQFKEGGNLGKDGQTRDRVDGRSDRGRGGFRGRGNHNNYLNGQNPQHAFTNGHGPQPPNGFIRQNSNPYSAAIPQPPFSNQYTQTPARGGRGGNRSLSIPNPAMYGRFPAALPQMPPNPMFDYQHMQPMSATPYSPFSIDHASVLAMVTMQLEYYFSIDNLCKDVYLRKHMDSQGFVFLSFIAGFKRIQALTQDFEMLRYACQESRTIDIIQGEDNIDRVRTNEGWETWVLAMEERDESVRNAGPNYHHRHQPRSQHMGQIVFPGNPTSPSQLPMSPDGMESGFPFQVNGAPVAPAINGNGHDRHPETPLSANVPVFEPVNGVSDPLEDETTFSDEQVAELTLVYQSPKGNDKSSSSNNFHTAPSRTFSNGSIDGKSIMEEIHENHQQGRTLTNGSRTSEAASPENLLRNAFTPLSPTGTSMMNNAPPVMWVKGRRQQAPVSEDSPQEKYTVVRTRALKNRESSPAGETHDDMRVLYEFWAHFLVRNFNPTMYSEFRKYAFEDAGKNATVGMKNLICYYDEVLNSKKKVIPDSLALHYVELVKNEQVNTEPNDEHPAFARLRAAWRNGALDMKSRKKIDNLVDAKLKEELER